MKLYIVRHAQSKRNIGHNSDVDAELTDDGKEQARRIGGYFHNIKIDHVYCSTLRRARATFEYMGPLLKGIPITYTDKIIEMKMGEFGNNGLDDWKEYFKAAIEAKGDEYYKFRPKKGESLEDVYKRARRFYKFLLKNHKNDSVLIIGHGIFSLYIILNALNLSLMEGKYYSLSNASVSTLDFDEKGKVTNFHVNDYHHLIKEGIKLSKKEEEN